MSKFSEKILGGSIPTEEEWTQHLIEAHKIAPSMTPNAFAAYRTTEGKNSYEVLAETLNSRDSKTLDLACGDGYLAQFVLPKLSDEGTYTGVDMSEVELGVAKKTFFDKRVKFQCAKAHSLPFQDGNFDVVFCHMALMLMLPVEPVVMEISRVLKTGGEFSAVIGNPAAQSGLLVEIQKLSFEFMTSRHPKIKEAKTGDKRVLTQEGLKSLFTSQLGFVDEIEIKPFELEVKTDAQGVWNMTKDLYFVGMLPSEEKEQLQRELEAFLISNSNSNGEIKYGYPMKKFAIRKRL